VTRRFLIPIALVSLAGCGGPDGRMETTAVTGRVTVDGQPAVDARVIFHPAAPFADKNADYPRAVVDADGKFSLSTYGEGDGAPPGDYKVTVDLSDQSEGLSRRSDPLKGRYRDPASSGLSATVAAGEAKPLAFELTGAK